MKNKLQACLEGGHKSNDSFKTSGSVEHGGQLGLTLCGRSPPEEPAQLMVLNRAGDSGGYRGHRLLARIDGHDYQIYKLSKVRDMLAHADARDCHRLSFTNSMFKGA